MRVLIEDARVWDGTGAAPFAGKGVFERVFKELSQAPDFEYALIDGTIIKVHRHGTGAKGGLKIRP